MFKSVAEIFIAFVSVVLNPFTSDIPSVSVPWLSALRVIRLGHCKASIPALWLCLTNPQASFQALWS